MALVEKVCWVVVILIYPVSLAGASVFTKMCPGIQLQAVDAIDSGETGYFQCTADGSDLLWFVDGVSVIAIQGFRESQTFFSSINLPNSTAILLTRGNNSVTTRTSVLVYRPDATISGIVPVACGTTGISECSVDVSVHIMPTTMNSMTDSTTTKTDSSTSTSASTTVESTSMENTSKENTAGESTSAESRTIVIALIIVLIFVVVLLLIPLAVLICLIVRLACFLKHTGFTCKKLFCPDCINKEVESTRRLQNQPSDNGEKLKEPVYDNEPKRPSRSGSPSR